MYVLPLLHQRCLNDGQIDLILRPRARHHTGRLAGVETLVRPGDPGQSEAAGD